MQAYVTILYTLGPIPSSRCKFCATMRHYQPQTTERSFKVHIREPHLMATKYSAHTHTHTHVDQSGSTTYSSQFNDRACVRGAAAERRSPGLESEAAVVLPPRAPPLSPPSLLAEPRTWPPPSPPPSSEWESNLEQKQQQTVKCTCARRYQPSLSLSPSNEPSFFQVSSTQMYWAVANNYNALYTMSV